jgi:hypothetical protein
MLTDYTEMHGQQNIKFYCHVTKNLNSNKSHTNYTKFSVTNALLKQNEELSFFLCITNNNKSKLIIYGQN